MNKEDLLLEIIEKVHDQGKDTAYRVSDIQQELARQGELHKINTKNLDEHMARTESLEKRVAFYDSISVIVAGCAALTLFIIKIYPYLSRFLK